MSDLSAPHFDNETAARRYLETLRWPDGPICPHCGNMGDYKTKREGVYRCIAKECRKDFSVRVGTIFAQGAPPGDGSAHVPVDLADGPDTVEVPSSK